MPLFKDKHTPGPRPASPARPQDRDPALEAVLRVGEVAASAAPLPQALAAMTDVAVELLGATQGSIMLLSEGGQELVLVAARGLPASVPLGWRARTSEGVAGQVAMTGRPLLLGEVEQHGFINFVPKQRRITSSIVVPLRVAGGNIGVLNLAITDNAGSFSEADVRLAQLFADQAAGLIHRAQLHERAEHRSADLTALVEASKGLLGILEVEGLLRAALDGATRLMGAGSGFACLFDDNTAALSRGVFRGMDRDQVRALIGSPDVRRVIEALQVALLDSDGAGALVAVGFRTSRGSSGLLVVAGERGHMSERGQVLYAFAQQVASALGAAELHEQVLRKESELASIIQGVPNPIVLVDAQQRIAALNHAAENLFGVSSSFSIGAPVAKTLGHAEVEALLLRDGDLQSEISLGSPPRTFKARVSDVRMPGAPVGRVLIMDDVTAERAIARAQRDFVAVIGHELRTPLTIIKGFAQTLLRRVDTASPAEARDALKTIDAKADHLGRLIEDLLYVAKIEAREATLRTEDVDVQLLVDGVVTELLERHPGRDVSADVPRGLHARCDRTKVALVLRHLIDNALKYSEADKPVTVRALVDAGELRFDVIDQGSGLVSSDIPHIFERFRQLDGSSTRSHGGMGVGLYLCAQLVKAHGGRIWVDSAWGRGSTFSFSLPERTPGEGVVSLGKRGATVSVPVAGRDRPGKATGLGEDL